MFHILSFFAILIPIIVLTPKHQSASEVFGTFLNLGGFSSQALAVFVGLITATNAFPGKPSIREIDIH